MVAALFSHRLEIIAARVSAADAATCDMVSKIVLHTARRLSFARQAANTARLHRLIESDALTEAAFALIDLELPQWKLRRLTYDEGEWHCAISRARELPEWLDQAVEAHHPNLTLAILSAYIETIRHVESSRTPGRPSVPQLPTNPYQQLGYESHA